MLLKYVPRLVGRAVGDRVFNWKDPEGKQPDITLTIKPGDNDVDDDVVMKVLGNSAFMRVALKGGFGDEAKKQAIAKAKEWAKAKALDIGLQKLAESDDPKAKMVAAAAQAAK